MARPQMYTPEQIQEIVNDFEQYIDDNDDPIIVGFCADYRKYRVNKDYINQHDEFYELRKRAIEKQEAYLVRNSTRNKINPTVSIFRLKQPQHGYRDRYDNDITTNGKDLPIPILSNIKEIEAAKQQSE